jgi:hypothetical protein
MFRCWWVIPRKFSSGYPLFKMFQNQFWDTTVSLLLSIESTRMHFVLSIIIASREPQSIFPPHFHHQQGFWSQLLDLNPCRPGTHLAPFVEFFVWRDVLKKRWNPMGPEHGQYICTYYIAMCMKKYPRNLCKCMYFYLSDSAKKTQAYNYIYISHRIHVWYIC